jgi:ribonuclease Z
MKGKIVILGTSSATPTKERNHPSIFFSYLGNYFLFDCGEGTQRQLIKANINFNRISKIFISHFHGDHVLGLPGLIQTFNFHNKERIEIFGPRGIREIIENMLKIAYFDKKTELVVKEFKVRNNEIFNLLKEDNYEINTIKLNHSIDSYGYSFREKDYFKYSKEKIKEFGLKREDFIKLEEKGFIERQGKKIYKEELGYYKKGFKFTYIADTYKTDNIFKIAKESDCLVIESTYFNEEDLAKEYKHLTFNYILENYEKFTELSIKNIILTHFSQRYKDLTIFKKELEKRKINNIILAHDFLTFNF